jgi:hypothetical protein
MSLKVLESSDVRSLLEEIGDGFFVVEFVKRDGTLRRMHCRRGVRKGLVDPASPQLPSYADHPNIVGVWSLKDQAYKCFKVDRVVSLIGAGRSLRVSE